MLWLVVVWSPAAAAHVTGRRELQSCGSATFVAVSSSECPRNTVRNPLSSLRNCYDSVRCGVTCEGDGECGTDPALDNCDGYDVYERSCPTPQPMNNVMDDSNIKTAVRAWLSHSASAEAKYGHISTWATGGVTDLSRLFALESSFNEDISAWDTSGVTKMSRMFYRARAFNQDIGGWAVDNVNMMYRMFSGARSFDQDLGWCVDDDVELEDAFYGTKCEETSCGVAQKDVIGICESPCLISTEHGICIINSPTLIMIILTVLLAGAGAYVRCKKKKDETYAAAARRVLCCRGTKVRAVAPTTSEDPVLPASMVSVVDAPAAGIAPNELGTVVSVKHNPPTN
jgi:surface protein